MERDADSPITLDEAIQRSNNAFLFDATLFPTDRQDMKADEIQDVIAESTADARFGVDQTVVMTAKDFIADLNFEQFKHRIYEKQHASLMAEMADMEDRRDTLVLLQSAESPR
jgi:hypothetical protein